MSLRQSIRRRSFHRLERLGWHLVRVSPGDPVPDHRALGGLDARVSALPGVDMREGAQLGLLDEFATWREELVELAIPPGFGALDVEVLHCMVRRHRPRRFIEVKSGVSTRVASRAMARNDPGSPGGAITVIDRDASADLATDPRVSIMREDVRAVPADVFGALAADDVLFIDTSHVLKTGSDVQHLYLEVIPRLAVGCLVHIHDIFLPREYPRDWYTQSLRSPNEQYLLQAFLAFNDAFEVLWSSSHMHEHHGDRLSGLFHGYDPTSARQGASFWIRRAR